MNKMFILIPLLGSLTELSAHRCWNWAEMDPFEEKINMLSERLSFLSQVQQNLSCGCNNASMSCNSSRGLGAATQVLMETSCKLFENSFTLSGEKASCEWCCPGHGQLAIERFIDQEGCKFTVKIKDAAKPLEILLKDGALRITTVADAKQEEEPSVTPKEEGLLERAKRYLTHAQSQNSTASSLAKSTSDQQTLKPFEVEVALPITGYNTAGIKGVVCGIVKLPASDNDKSGESNSTTEETVQDAMQDTAVDSSSESESSATVPEQDMTDISEFLREGKIVAVTGDSLELFLELEKTTNVPSV